MHTCIRKSGSRKIGVFRSEIKTVSLHIFKYKYLTRVQQRIQGCELYLYSIHAICYILYQHWSNITNISKFGVLRRNLFVWNIYYILVWYSWPGLNAWLLSYSFWGLSIVCWYHRKIWNHSMLFRILLVFFLRNN